MAEMDRQWIEQLIKRPQESLAVEIKTWIDPTGPAGQEKIVKAAIALRNHGGGALVIGLNNDTLKAECNGKPDDVRAAFHVDVIQGVVSKYSSETFEVAVEFVEHDGVIHPVIVIPPGVQTPVCAKATLTGEGGKVHVEKDAVYVRTLESNNTASTSKAKAKDWRRLVDICFENREADIGRFLRRHLAGVDASALREIMSTVVGSAPIQQSMSEQLEGVLGQGAARFLALTKERGLNLPPHGSWEVALIIDGQFQVPALSEFANLLSSSNPSYTGWPVWLSSRQFGNRDQRPYIMEGSWETLIADFGPAMFPALDFMRQDPSGRFYLYRALEDDITWNGRAPKPMAFLDAILPMLRVAEAIAVGIAFAAALQVDERAKLEFMFRWKGLKDRVLTSWANPARYITPRTAKQDAVTSMVTVPVDVPPSALAEYVKTAIKPLYEIFDGFTLPGSVVDELTQKLLERRL
ncbi:gp78 [Burkholderia pseudomallei]|uniref:Gp78 n=4 Tax=root TaxID=1 RepID=Q6JIF3_9CAUD|nr:ATP-binding protein [Burkholderia pseudomallei]NP_945109.1 ATP-binding protein [Burkholderia phage phi1026b]UNI72045.1 putative ATP-binding protein [Burkholderia phage PhiBP82.1]WNO23890.1 hypothetical protein PhiBTCVTUL1a_81 [Burkholderia phage phiBtTUL1a]AAR23229.1 gp78 [Burkholderia phage phi1026b]AIP15475.1 divergent AAA domain protein [Burkholderia pseudomallei]AJX06171.1 divergent AAA domain protein [Burkholderia pseudomallei 1026b]